MLNEQLQHYQDILDEEIGVCPKCGKPTKWGILKDFGCCEKCWDKMVDKEENWEKADKKDLEKLKK